MKKSTVLVVGTLALVGSGAYFYLKGKKPSLVNNAPPTTLGTSNGTGATTATSTSNGTVATTATTASNTQSPSVVDYSLGLNPIIKTTAIDSDSSVIKTVVKDSTTGITKTITTDLKSGTEVTTVVKSDPTTVTVRTITEEEKNRLEASQLASKIRTLDILPSFIKPYNAGTLIAQYSKQINALGYKLLPDFNIEKM